MQIFDWYTVRELLKKLQYHCWIILECTIKTYVSLLWNAGKSVFTIANLQIFSRIAQLKMWLKIVALEFGAHPTSIVPTGNISYLSVGIQTMTHVKLIFMIDHIVVSSQAAVMTVKILSMYNHLIRYTFRLAQCRPRWLLRYLTISIWNEKSWKTWATS